MTNRPHLFFVSGLLVLWLLMMVIVNPIGDFPLNDDWTYGASVRYMLNTGQFRILDGSACAIFTQIVWGTLFCIPFGFSYTALRISTLVLGVIGGIVLYFLAFEICKNKKLSFFAALLLMVNPMYFSLSYTYMTDIPFLSFAIISCWFFFKAFSNKSYWYVVFGTLFSLAATLVRQAGIVIPLAYAFAILFTQKGSYKQWARILIPPVFANVVLFMFMSWMKHSNPLFEPFQNSTGIQLFFQNPGGYAYRIFMRTGDLLYYSGFFLLPILLFSTPKAFMVLPTRQKNIVVLGTLVFVPSIIRVWSALPIGNIINEYGIGPRLFSDVYILNLIKPGLYGIGLKIIITIGMAGALLAAVNLVMVIEKVISAVRRKDFLADNSRSAFLIFFLFGYSLLIFTPFNFFDRYTLPVFVLLLLIILQNVPADFFQIPTGKLVRPALTITIALFAVLSTHDYLSWNRARWQALNYLNHDLKVSPLRIDGGYEYNGWMLGSNTLPTKNKSWWYVVDDEYLLSFGPVNGYKVFKQFDCCSYIPFEHVSIFVLHRE